MCNPRRRWMQTCCTILSAGAVLTIQACGGAPDGSWNDTQVETDEQTILGGTPASAYPEAVLVDMYQNNALRAVCSGSVIAPRVVLTAGHCVEGFNGWRVIAPFANKQVVKTKDAAVYDWDNYPSTTVNPKQHDIALIFLATPITLGSYPTLANARVADGTSVVNIGRKRDGSLSMSTLYVSKAITVSDGTRYGYPYDYRASNVIESGDSGGPVEQAGTHTIVAVNSGGGSKSEVLARVDLLYTWIQQQVQAHGGF